jgi:hypothetical protein
MFCPHCGTTAGPDQRFCRNCGAALGVAARAQSAAAAYAGLAAQAAPQPPPGSLHAIPDGGLTMEEVVAWLESGGYSAKVVTTESGKRHILSNSHGHPFDIFTPGCISGRCASLELVAGLIVDGKFNVSKLNEWNGKFLWCKAYYDSAIGPCLAMDIALWPGGTFEALNHQFAAWNDRHDKFVRFLE